MGDNCQIPCQMVQEIHGDVAKLRKIVFEGNGDSIVTKVTILERNMSTITKLTWAVLGTVITILGTVILKHF